MRPADFPPPFDPNEFIAEPTDPADERIDVGILIVGGGPAGLAAAIRAAQLLEERPELAERLGDVPIAVVEKGKAPGAHLLSGAVVNPRAFRKLFPGMLTEDMPFIAPVEREGVYYLTRASARSASRRRRRCGTTATASPRSTRSAAGWPSAPRSSA